MQWYCLALDDSGALWWDRGFALARLESRACHGDRSWRRGDWCGAINAKDEEWFSSPPPTLELMMPISFTGIDDKEALTTRQWTKDAKSQEAGPTGQ